MPRSLWAFVAVLHGDAPEFLAYALVLARQLRLYSPGLDRVLLLGPGCWREPSARNALAWAGWTHLEFVEAISAAHLDRTGRKRHKLVFTKLRALEVPYERVLLLDLDLLPRKDKDLTKLLNVAAPAGKYHGAYKAAKSLPHGKLVPRKARQVRWCPNTGVLRLDPRPTAEERRMQVQELADSLAAVGTEAASYLPDQYFLAEKLSGWRHISRSFNYEVAIGDVDGYKSSLPLQAVLQQTKVWHYSGKNGLQPPMFLDLESEDDVRRWLQEHYWEQDPTGIIAHAFAEWRGAMDALLADEPVPPAVRQVVEEMRARGETDRGDLDSFRARKRAQHEAYLAPELSGKARPRHYEDWDEGYDFVGFVAWYREEASPGPQGDRDALEQARLAFARCERLSDDFDDAVRDALAQDPSLRGERRWGGSRAYEFKAYVNYFASFPWVWHDPSLGPVNVARIAWAEAEDASLPGREPHWPEDHHKELSALAESAALEDPGLRGRRRWAPWGARSYSFEDFCFFYGDCWYGSSEGAVKLARITWANRPLAEVN